MTATSASSATPPALLQVSDLSKSFGGVLAVEGVGFDVSSGHIKGIIGPNGAGKSTLLNLIGGSLRPDRGAVVMGGIRPDRLPAHDVARYGVARTFQLVRLFSNNGTTVLDNVLLGAHLRFAPSILSTLTGRNGGKEERFRAKAREWLDFFGLGQMEAQQPRSLAFGQQRYVELARAMMLEPKLLLLDEPASGLNDAEVNAFASVLRKIRDEGVTIVLIEHDMKLIMNISDEILVLAQGRKLAEGTPEQVRNDPEDIEAYLGAPQATH